jgi:hypothetical protein
MTSRLHVGDKARILESLNMRSNHYVDPKNFLQTNPANTKVEIIGGPVCADGYLWWKIRVLDHPEEGWSAETTRSGTKYFLAPYPTPTP